MVWREGFELLVSKPRHLVFGVGLDSIKGHWRQWGLFDNGRQPIGHMHSNLLQIALERGVPALIVWLILIGIYVRMLWRHSIREKTQDRNTDQFLEGRGSRRARRNDRLLHERPGPLQLGRLGSRNCFLLHHGIVFGS